MAKATDLARRDDPKAPALKGGPHKARHTYASHFLRTRPDLFLLGRVLGHSHSRVTELYGHLLPDHLAEARNVVQFASPAASPPPLAPTAKVRMQLPRNRARDRAHLVPAGSKRRGIPRNQVGAIGFEPTPPTVSM